MEMEEFLLVYMVDEVDLGYNRRGLTQMPGREEKVVPIFGTLLDQKMEREEALERLKKKRTILRTSLSKYGKRIEEYDVHKECDHEELLGQLSDVYEELRRVDEEIAEASQELLWLLDLLKDLELEQKAPIYFHQDNQSCLKICSSEKVSSRTKHIATKIHHLKDLQKKTVIKMVYCPTGDMKADILTKPLPRPTFEKLRYNLVMSPHSCRGFVG
ncbi:hypothetical protein LAZ67_3003425 [Cordylochernes scorpioides]|uniref:Uncharacterized protein n=1 Tax=Cordylochernes scorpioides TaxID=51811 RepID=A0ABY6K9W8_9ARAC|nr:hypothetical protein LAZ67_3003425 [Cordylochernes scorpioides]